MGIHMHISSTLHQAYTGSILVVVVVVVVVVVLPLSLSIIIFIILIIFIRIIIFIICIIVIIIFVIIIVIIIIVVIISSTLHQAYTGAGISAAVVGQAAILRTRISTPHPHYRAPCMKYLEGSARLIYLYHPREYVILGP